MTTLNELGMLSASQGTLSSVLAQIVEAAIVISEADFGNIQLLDPTSGDLQIVAQRGFPNWWVTFWNRVSKGQGVCGTALQQGRRVIVENVEQSPLFADATTRNMQRKAGVCGVQSTPLVSRSGTVLGMFSTHYKTPHRLDEHTLSLLDLLARQAADLIERTQAEEALRASRAVAEHHAEELDHLYQTSPVGLAFIDRDLHFVRINQALASINGRSVEEHLGRTLREVLPDLADTLEPICRRVIDDGEPIRDIEVTGQTAALAGVKRHWLASYYPVRTPVGPVYGVNVVVQEITERKRAEEALRASEQRFRAIYDQTYEFIGLLNSDGTLLDANHTALAFRGLHLSDVVGKPFWKTPWWDLSPQLQEKLKVAISQAAQGQFIRLNAQHRGKEGEIDEIDFSLTPIADRNGKVIQIISEGRRITALTRVQDQLRQAHAELEHRVQERTRDLEQASGALRESEERLRLAYQAARIGTFESNLQTGVHTWTPELEALYGLKPGAFARTQLAWEQLVHPDDRAETTRMMDQAVTTGEPTQGEWRVVWPDGSLHWLVGRWQVFKGEAGTPLRMIGITFDITKRKQAEDTVRQQRAQLEALTAQLILVQECERQRIARDLHDDITQRLAALAIDLRSLCLRGSVLDESASVELEQLGQRAKLLTADVQRMAHQLHPSILEHIGLEAAVREHVDEFAGRTGLTTQLVVRRLPPTIPLEQATCLFRVLQESLQNVRKHANATTVLIRLLKTEQGVGLCVHDDGRGFEHSLETERPRGLGLSSMEERVGILKGTLRIKTKPGDGTEIHAWVPLESREVSHAAGAGP